MENLCLSQEIVGMFATSHSQASMYGTKGDRALVGFSSLLCSNLLTVTPLIYYL